MKLTISIHKIYLLTRALAIQVIEETPGNADIGIFMQMRVRMQTWPEAVQAGIRCLGFIDRMGLAYRCATVIASRAGAMSIAELALVGKPTILVPSPVVAEDHQTKNARSLSDRDGAILLPDSEVVDGLKAAIVGLLEDSDRAKSLQTNLLNAARPEAANDVVSELEKLL